MRSRHLLVLTLVLTLWVASLAAAASPLGAAVPPPPGDLGPSVQHLQVWCASGPVRLEFYDFVPEDPDYWRAISVHLGNEDHWLLLLVWDYPEEDPPLSVWVDRNRDGRPETYERFGSLGEYTRKYGRTFCETVAILLQAAGRS